MSRLEIFLSLSFCASVKTRQFRRTAPVKARQVRAPFEAVSVDILGPYPETQNKNEYIVVLQNLFTKWVEAKALPDSKAKQVIDCLEVEIFPRYGPPQRTITDNGGPFLSKAYERFCLKHHMTSEVPAVYKQKENPVERKVQDIKKILRTLLFEKYHKDDWDE